MKKLYLSLALILAMLLLACAAFAEETAVSSKDMDFYLIHKDDVQTKTVYFIGESDVPYMSLADFGELYTYLLKTYVNKGQNISFGLSYSQDGQTGTLTRTDGDPFTMTVDCDADTITFLDYDAFIRPEADRVLLDVLEADNPHGDDDVKFFRRAEGSYERYGDQVVLDAGSYGIDFAADENGVYVPVQTLCDFLLSLKYVNPFYNGEAFFFVKMGDEESNLTDAEGEKTEFGKLFYSVEPKELSEAMANYSYAELCLAFDNLYGLKESHGIKSFNDLALQMGAREAFLSGDPNYADAALFGAIMLHLDDLHSCVLAQSPFTTGGFGMGAQQFGVGRALLDSGKQDAIYGAARALYYPDGVPAYEEIGNTAYITFDSFAPVPEGVDYYKTAPTADATDTIGIMAYAYSQIMREDSPIENVVLDLSKNGGGDADTAVFVLASFLGDGYASVQNTMSGALATGVYNVDLNLDGQFDENDLGLLGKKRFALITQNSFSCGNLVPNIFKNSHEVSLIGHTSGGGSCVVLPLTTAYGTYFRISGPQRLAFVKNGSFYDVDRGAEADYPLFFPESYYDREELTDYVNTIK